MKIQIISLLICCLAIQISCAEKSSLPEVKNIVGFKANSVSPLAHFKDFKIERSDLEHIIDTYYQISEGNWRHNYHHIAMNDVTGIIILKDGTEINGWFVPEVLQL